MPSKRRFKEKEKLSHSSHHLKYAGRRTLLPVNMNIKVHSYFAGDTSLFLSLIIIIIFLLKKTDNYF